MSTIFKGESFTIGSGNKIVILIHGFTASTQEMESLGIILAERGYRVIVPLLPGHNRDFTTFSKTDIDQYEERIFSFFDSADEEASIDIVGISFGAILALHVAENRSVHKIVLLSPAVYYFHHIFLSIPFLKKLQSKIMKKKKGQYRWDLYKEESSKERIAYPWFSLSQFENVVKLTRTVINRLKMVDIPVLIVHSKRDRTVKCKSAEFIYENISSKEKEIMWLSKSGHIITEDYEAEAVREKIVDFLSR